MMPKPSDYNPYKDKFPRGMFLSKLGVEGRIHPLRRGEFEEYFRSMNPDGFMHDLGAQDVFLDNYGLLFQEQLRNPDVEEEYLGNLMLRLLVWWELTKGQVLQANPFWGEYYNSTRTANAGEPRSLLRLMAERNLLEFPSTGFLLPFDPEQQLEGMRMLEDRPPLPRSIIDFPDPFHFLRERQAVRPISFHYDSWEPSRYLDHDLPRSDEKFESSLSPGGLILERDPKDMQELRLLHPRHATPDLPLRVGIKGNELDLLDGIVRTQDDQSCLAQAVCMGLDILLRRMCPEKQFARFDARKLYWDTGSKDDGRNLEDTMKFLQQRLPQSEKGERPEHPDDLQPPIIHPMDGDDISSIKARLAAGWVVIVGTGWVKSVYDSNAFEEWGMPLCPLPGQPVEDLGHAWCLFGYDHVDGGQSWKYQGRFLTLSSWGEGYPRIPFRECPGVLTLPFATLVTHGDKKAYALRLRRR